MRKKLIESHIHIQKDLEIRQKSVLEEPFSTISCILKKHVFQIPQKLTPMIINETTVT